MKVSGNLINTFTYELCRAFGSAAQVTRETIRILSQILANQPTSTAFLKWQELRFNATGCDHIVWQKANDVIAQKLHINDTKNSTSLLFVVETFLSLILSAFLRHNNQNLPDVAVIYQWPFEVCDLKAKEKFESCTTIINGTVEQLVTSGLYLKSQCDDIFGALYANLFPTAARKHLGEFYTPAWLADHLLTAAGFEEAIVCEKNIRLLDPACGSGTFLLATARRMMQAGISPEKIVQSVVGFDLNPLAVMMSTANLSKLLALRDGNDRLQLSGIPPIQIACHDSIQNISPFGATDTVEPNRRFDFVVGNPPWLTWDKLPPDYRAQTAALWQRYGLFNLSGKDARYGGAKKELALLMVATNADHYLKPGGRLAMVLPQAVFQTHKTGNGFRRFGGNDPAAALKVLRVDDFSAMRVFRDATTKTATLVLEKGKPTTYPVPYFVWKTPQQCRACHAVPVVPGQPGSAWRITSLMEQCNPSQVVQVSQKSDYTAMLGANTGGANGIYWVEIVSTRTDKVVTVRNLIVSGKLPLPVIEAEIEAEVLYPLLRWRDLDRFSAVPSTWSIIVQDPVTRVGLPLEVMQAKYPKTLSFLQNFETRLRNRAAFKKYLSDAPFYSMYNISRETFAPIKVVWRRMDTRIRAAVVQPFVTSWNLPFAQGRPVIPQETCSMLAVADLDEAYYLAALLNSMTVHHLVATSSVQGGKGFGTPGMLEHLPIRRFDATNEWHIKLARIGRTASKCLSRERDRLLEEMEKIAEHLLK